jgi:hypothetical protein
MIHHGIRRRFGRAGQWQGPLRKVHTSDACLRQPLGSKRRGRTFPAGYCSFANSDLASFSRGMPGSASFQSARKVL